MSRAVLDRSIGTNADLLNGWGIFLCAVLLLTGGGPSTSTTQSTAETELGALRPPVSLIESTEKEWGAGAFWGRGSPVSRRSETASPSVRFGRTLGGSIVGVAAGTGLGLLLWRAAADEGFGNDGDDPAWQDRSDADGVLFGMGLLAIATGGPIGSVVGARLDERRRDAYVLSGVGEVVLGGLGYGLVHQLEGNATGRLAGLGVGAALGAALGTVLVASQGSRGAVAYQNGSWRAAPPEVRVQPALFSDRSPSLRVTLVSVRL